MSDFLRIVREKTNSFGWTERILGGLLLTVTLVLVLMVGLMILGALVASALVLTGWLYWWRGRLLKSHVANPQVISGNHTGPGSYDPVDSLNSHQPPGTKQNPWTVKTTHHD